MRAAGHVYVTPRKKPGLPGTGRLPGWQDSVHTVTSLLGEANGVPTTLREKSRKLLTGSLLDPAPDTSCHWAPGGFPESWESFWQTTEPEGGLKDLAPAVSRSSGAEQLGWGPSPFLGLRVPSGNKQDSNPGPLVISDRQKECSGSVGGGKGWQCFLSTGNSGKRIRGLPGAHRPQVGHRARRRKVTDTREHGHVWGAISGQPQT